MNKSFLINGDQGLHLGHLRRAWRSGSTCYKCSCLSNVTGYTKAEGKGSIPQTAEDLCEFFCECHCRVTKRFLLTSKHLLCAAEFQVQGSASRSLLCFYKPLCLKTPTSPTNTCPRPLPSNYPILAFLLPSPEPASLSLTRRSPGEDISVRQAVIMKATSNCSSRSTVGTRC